MKMYANGFFQGQEVICTAEGEPSLAYPCKPRKGTIGIIVNYDPCDSTFSIRWNGGFEPLRPAGERIACWTSVLFVQPHIPEPIRRENGMRECNCCGALIPEEEKMTYLPGFGWVCKDCLDTQYAKCDICGFWHRKEDTRRMMVHVSDYNAEEKTVCNECLVNESYFYRCADCDTWFDYFLEAYLPTVNGYVCHECANNYKECPECGELVRSDDLILIPQFDRPVCPKCRIRARQKAIHNYSYKPRPKFKVGNSHEQYETDRDITDILMGVELEVDKGEGDIDCANDIIEVCPDVYCKHDGSLTHGIEIVSHPATLEYHLNELGWDRISAICRQYKFKSHEAKTCGLHVHIGRRQLGTNDAEREKTAAKLVLLMVRHWDNMVKFSRRLPSQLNWCECNRPDMDFVYDEPTLIDAALETIDDGRYQAVNLCNDATVEIRLFRGSLEVNTIKATLEMVSNMARYCKYHTALEVMNSQWADIAYYGKYEELYDYLEERKIGETQMTLLPALPEWNYPEKNSDTKDCTFSGSYCLGVTATEMVGPDMPHVPNRVLHVSSGNRNDRDFEIGEYVLVVDSNSYDAEAPIGRVGRVISNSDTIGVRFSEINNRWHILNGRIPDCSGYFLRPYHLVHYTGPHSEIPMEGELEEEVEERDVFPWPTIHVDAEPQFVF